MAPVFFGGERFIARQLDDGGWAVIDRRHEELVGAADRSHERAERRAAALNALNARRAVEGRPLAREERDQISAEIQAHPAPR
jgi:hypothetical protein